MTVDVLCTAIVVGIAAFSLTRYRRLNSSYDRSRPSIPSDRSFRAVYGVLILGVLALTVLAYWSDGPWMLKLHDSEVLRLAGVLIAVMGIALFEWSARTLGSQYSPCFDLRKPGQRVTEGPYRYLDHPMYVGNVGALVGLFVSAGSVWLLWAVMIVTVYYWRSAGREKGMWEGAL